jgi:hypothetical protein
MFAVVVYAFMSMWFTKANSRRRQGLEDERISGMSHDEINEMGDRNPRFVYTI